MQENWDVTKDWIQPYFLLVFYMDEDQGNYQQSKLTMMKISHHLNKCWNIYDAHLREEYTGIKIHRWHCPDDFTVTWEIANDKMDLTHKSLKGKNLPLSSLYKSLLNISGWTVRKWINLPWNISGTKDWKACFWWITWKNQSVRMAEASIHIQICATKIHAIK